MFLACRIVHFRNTVHGSAYKSLGRNSYIFTQMFLLIRVWCHNNFGILGSKPRRDASAGGISVIYIIIIMTILRF